MLEIAVIFIFAGCCAGFLAGLLGIGGGFVVVPLLIWALPMVNLPADQVPHFAIGTSLLCICVTAIFSTKAHHQKGAVDWRLFKIVAPGLVIGSLLGAILAGYLSGQWLILLFVSGALLTAVYLLSGHVPSAHQSLSPWPFFWYGKFTGCVSALIGIGGGSVLVPFLVYKGKPMVSSVGTAAACGLPIALIGAFGYAITGLQNASPTAWATGYLYWPAFLGIVIFSSLSAPWGAKLAHRLPAPRLKQAFAAFLFFSSGQILYSHWLS